jgi:hypothetical protein
MLRRMRVTMLLADAAQSVGGKLYVLGGGWALIGPAPTPSAIALYIEVPWDQANMRHDWRIELLDSDGQPVTLRDELNREQPVVVAGQLEVGRPAGLTPGTPIGVSLAVNLAPLPLAPGGRYEWRLTIGTESREDWRLAFSTRPA